MFQHTATRRWLPKGNHIYQSSNLRFNTQPPEGGCLRIFSFMFIIQSFNTQPPEGGCTCWHHDTEMRKGFNTQPPEGGCLLSSVIGQHQDMFQHTATRRWLPLLWAFKRITKWFQHTATRRWLLVNSLVKSIYCNSFNTQPPEGGCILQNVYYARIWKFQHTATRRWLL